MVQKSAVSASVSPRPEKEFVCCRATLQRLHDAMICGGWVEHMSHNHASLRLIGDRPVMLGESFYCEIHGPLALLSFKATCSGIHEDPAAMANGGRLTDDFGAGVGIDLFFMGRPVFLAPREKCRKKANGLTSVIKAGADSMDARLIDISLDGAGLILLDPIAKGTEVQFSVTTNKRVIQLGGIIRFIKRRSETTYQAGLELTSVDRVQRILWQELFNSI